ncbi:MAG: hypothetical protein NUK65_13840, partial [Firmicutes bacterium]|nr:hypothetical protein [Bacillota bacterium]
MFALVATYPLLLFFAILSKLRGIMTKYTYSLRYYYLSFFGGLIMKLLSLIADYPILAIVGDLPLQITGFSA